VRFQDLTAASMKTTVFWVVAPCSLVEVYRSFGGECSLHYQGVQTSETSVKSYQTTWRTNPKGRHLHTFTLNKCTEYFTVWHHYWNFYILRVKSYVSPLWKTDSNYQQATALRKIWVLVSSYAPGRPSDRSSRHRFSWFSSVFKQILRWFPSSKFLLHDSPIGGHQITYVSKLCMSKATTSYHSKAFTSTLPLLEGLAGKVWEPYDKLMIFLTALPPEIKCLSVVFSLHLLFHSFAFVLYHCKWTKLACIGWSITQPILKYVFMVAIQYNSIGLINTTSLWLCKSPRRSPHVVICSSQSVSYQSNVEVQGCLFHKCNECSLSNTTWHLILT
jgi:hypothetical protein